VLLDREAPGVVPDAADVVLDEQHLARDVPRRDLAARRPPLPPRDEEGREEEEVERRVEFQPAPEEEPPHAHGPPAEVLAEQQARDEVAGQHEEQVHPDPPDAVEFAEDRRQAVAGRPGVAADHEQAGGEAEAVEGEEAGGRHGRTPVRRWGTA
jgi:hypothetical protein